MKNIQQYIVLFLMILLLVPQTMRGQEDKQKFIIKGVVEDALGPIVGASVIAKNQPGVGTITDLDGNFPSRWDRMMCCRSPLWGIRQWKFPSCPLKTGIIFQ